MEKLNDDEASKPSKDSKEKSSSDKNNERSARSDRKETAHHPLDKKAVEPARFFDPPKKDKDDEKDLFGLQSKRGTSKEPSPVDPETDSDALAADQLDSDTEALDEGVEQHDMTDAEVGDVTEMIIDEHEADVFAELEETAEGSIEEFVALADAVFLDSLGEKVASGEPLTENDLDAAVEETIADMQLESAETEATAHDEENEAQDDAQTASPDQPTPNTPSPPHSSDPPTPASPPNTPLPPNGPPPNPPGPNGPPSPSGPQGPNTPNSNQALTNPNTTGNVIHSNYLRRRRGRDVLVGGLIGYVVGRRGGRKRAEKRLRPEISKLETQVTKLHNAVAEREEKVRKLAAEVAIEVEAGQAQTETLVKNRQERKKMRAEIAHREALREDSRVETVGKANLAFVGVERERRVGELVDRKENAANPRKSIETMTKDELLHTIKGVHVNDLLITDAFKHGRIGEDHLREIVKAYVRNRGDVERIFMQHLQSDKREVLQKSKEAQDVHETRDRVASDLPLVGAISHPHSTTQSSQPQRSQASRAATPALHGQYLQASASSSKQAKTLVGAALVVLLVVAGVVFLILQS